MFFRWIYGWHRIDKRHLRRFFEVVKLLLDNGAAVNTADGFGWTPLLLAVDNGHTEIVKLLLGKGR